jgi:hypothetical protein
MVSLPWALVVSPLQGVKSGQVKQRKSSVGRAMVIAGQWSMPVVAWQSSQCGSGKLNTLAARGLEELFFSCAVVSVFSSGGK